MRGAGCQIALVSAWGRLRFGERQAGDRVARESGRWYRAAQSHVAHAEIEEVTADRNGATYVEILGATIRSLPVARWAFAFRHRLQDHGVTFLADRNFIENEGS